MLATPESLAMLLISVALPNLSEVGRQAKLVASLKSMTEHCPLTGKRTLGSALTAVLQSEELAHRASFFRIDRGGSEFDATLAYDSVYGPSGELGEADSQLSNFGNDKSRESRLWTKTYLLNVWENALFFLRGTTS